MTEQATFGDFVLGLEGLAILRSWALDPLTVKTRAQRILDIATQFESDGAMDIAICTLALTHCADLEPPVRELARVVRHGGSIVISDVHPFMVMLGGHGSYQRNDTENAFVRNYAHLTSDYLAAFQKAGLNVVRCMEPLWGDQEIAAMGFANEMPDLMKAAVKDLPIVIVWELEKIS